MYRFQKISLFFFNELNFCLGEAVLISSHEEEETVLVCIRSRRSRSLIDLNNILSFWTRQWILQRRRRWWGDSSLHYLERAYIRKTTTRKGKTNFHENINPTKEQKKIGESIGQLKEEEEKFKPFINPRA